MKCVLAALALVLLTGPAPLPVPATGATLTLTPVFVRGSGGGGASAPILSGAAIYGSAPAAVNAPMHQIGSTSVATIPNSGGTPTSCNITAGDPSGNFQCVISGGTVQITYTSTGATNLDGSSDLATQTLTVTATNTGGTSSGVSVPVNVYADGALQAPAGTPQFPTAFSGYATRPPWLVAGIDYLAGRDPTVTMTPASSAAVSGCTVNSGASPPNITCTGTGKILDKIDFSVSSGYVAIFQACTSCGITNSKFAGGSNYQNPPLTSTVIVGTDTSSPGFIFTGNDYDAGCSTTSGASQLFLQGGGTTTYKHNYSHRRPQHVLEFSTNSGVLDRSWNLIEGGGCSTSSHGNILQYGGGSATPTVRFEAFVWGPSTYLGLQSELWQFNHFNPGTMTNPALRRSVVIVPSTANPGISYATHWWDDPSNTRVGTMSMIGNYMDLGGNAGVTAFGSLYRAGACSNIAPTSISGNIDLNTGGALAIGDVVTGGC